MGLASTKHLEEVWALLEQLCSTWFLRWRNLSPEAQVARPLVAILQRVVQGRECLSQPACLLVTRGSQRAGMWDKVR